MTEQVVGVVLAGGRGSRLGGVDKGLQSFDGKPLVEHALLALQGLHQRVISANRNKDRYAALGCPVVADRREDFQGPLSGIESVMLEHPADWYLTCPADVLGVPDGWAQLLLEQARKQQVPWVGTRDGDRLQPLLSLWSRELLAALSVYLDDGGRRVMAFVEPWAATALPLPAGEALHNLNTPEQLAALENKR